MFAYKLKHFTQLLWIEDNPNVKQEIKYLDSLFGNQFVFCESIDKAQKQIEEKKSSKFVIMTCSKLIDKVIEKFKYSPNVYPRYIIFCGSEKRAEEWKKKFAEKLKEEKAKEEKQEKQQKKEKEQQGESEQKQRMSELLGATPYIDQIMLFVVTQEEHLMKNKKKEKFLFDHIKVYWLFTDSVSKQYAQSKTKYFQWKQDLEVLSEDQKKFSKVLEGDNEQDYIIITEYETKCHHLLEKHKNIMMWIKHENQSNALVDDEADKKFQGDEEEMMGDEEDEKYPGIIKNARSEKQVLAILKQFLNGKKQK